MDIKKNPVAMPVGPFDLSPVLEIGETYNDNIFQHNSNQKDSFLTQIHAGGQLSLVRKFNRYALTYALQSSEYHSSPQDNYVDHYIGTNTHTEFTSRNRLDVDLKYLNSHYMRGYFLGRDLLGPSSTGQEPDQYHLYGANARYRYGRQEAKGNIELQTNVDDYTFDNNRENMARQDRTRFGLTPGFYYRMLPKTVLQINAENIWTFHKDTEAAAFDNIKQRFLVGGSWQYSQQLQTTARVGYLHQTFENSAFNGFDDATWDLNLRWSPLNYSRLNFSLARDATPSIASANIRKSDRYQIDWTHDWSSRLSTQVTSSYENAHNLAIHRQDDYKSFGLDVNYGVRRWLGIGINYTYRGLQSGNQSLDFDQNTVLFYVTGNPRLSDEVKTPWASWY